MPLQHAEDTQSLERWQIIDQNFNKRVIAGDLPRFEEFESGSKFEHSEILSKKEFITLFSQQITIRHIDLLSRALKLKNLGFYTIASAGHENNIALSHVFKIQDPALLHYRSGAFMLNRAYQHSGDEGVDKQIIEQLKSLVAAKSEKISNGRHKVFGSVELNVPPQTSTIASHLPKAVGLALSINQKRILKYSSDSNPSALKMASNSVVLCSFGDASFNHSTAQGAINAAKILNYQQVPLPLVFICEDNNIGISVKTPTDWIYQSMSKQTNIIYLKADGLNLFDVILKAYQAEKIARIKKIPVFLHIVTVRLMGHAGSDIEQHYLSLSEIQKNESQDPLLYTASLALQNKYLDQQEIINIYESIREKITNLSKNILNEPKLGSAKEVMASVIPTQLKRKTPRIISKKNSEEIFSFIMPTWRTPRNLCQAMTLVLAETLAQYKNAVIFGEDVGKKGGVYRVTANLQQYFGRKKVFDTILDEQTIIGTAIGFAQNDLLPIIEIQFLAYIHNAIDQLRGEASTLSFFSAGKLANPLIIRLPGLAYQKGFGGHFHNDNSIASLRDIPGILIACPSNANDAVIMWRSIVKAVYSEYRICVFIEPIALYFSKFLSVYPESDDNSKKFNIGDIGIKIISMLAPSEIQGQVQNQDQNQCKSELVVISYGNGYVYSLQAVNNIIDKKTALNKMPTTINMVDLRWLNPLPLESLENLFSEISQNSMNVEVLIIDECRRTGSLSEGLLTDLYALFLGENKLSNIHLHRLTGEDSFIPLGPAAEQVLPKVSDIEQAILKIYNI